MRSTKIFKLPFLFIVILLISNLALPAQKQPNKKTEVLLCGTIHYIPDSLKQNWQGFRKFLEDYKPDAICVEYRMPADSVSLMQADGKNYVKELDSLAKAWKISMPKAKARIKELYAALKQTDDWAKRIELYQLLYVHADFGNANFQAWRAYNSISKLQEDKRNEIRKTNPFYKRIEWLVRNLKNGEYSNVVFPLAVEFKIDYLIPVDDRTYNMRFSIAYTSAYDEVAGTKFENKAKTFWEEFIKTESSEMAKGNGLMFVNSAAWQKTSDYAQTGLYLSSGNRHHKDYVKYWNLRNKKVASNILDEIKGKGFKRVLVVMGYMHIPNMKKHMKNEKNISLKTISDY
jgi:hypothetical protein